ncbi:protein of unknown function [Xenorhabdus doucetiae]|uniref:Uncharacterized protein n=1 Tax=Xenorhabdus doucetiae TaxID=351671 RepID=A0A068QXR1_9GAMM|nr:protein of unknown function [Xenorhabdus doucetiae]
MSHFYVIFWPYQSYDHILIMEKKYKNSLYCLSDMKYNISAKKQSRV